MCNLFFATKLPTSNQNPKFVLEMSLRCPGDVPEMSCDLLDRFCGKHSFEKIVANLTAAGVRIKDSIDFSEMSIIVVALQDCHPVECSQLTICCESVEVRVAGIVASQSLVISHHGHPWQRIVTAKMHIAKISASHPIAISML